MMQCRRLILALVLCALAAGTALAEDKAMSAEEQKQMEMWMKSMTPNEHHQGLADMAGEFTMTSRMWEDPSAPATESKGKVQRKTILGGRYLMEEVNSEMMGMPFEGLGIIAYDNITGEYQHLWLDSMSTGMCVGSGAMNANVLTSNLSYSNPMTWKKDTAQTIFKIVDKDKQIFEWYENRDGKMVKTMEIEYVRAGKAPSAAGGKTPSSSSGGGW